MVNVRFDEELDEEGQELGVPRKCGQSETKL